MKRDIDIKEISDGKLYTRSSKRGDIREVLHQFVAFGASPSILIDAHPHIGTDKLKEGLCGKVSALALNVKIK